jgi:hypothetical protein
MTSHKDWSRDSMIESAFALVQEQMEVRTASETVSPNRKARRLCRLRARRAAVGEDLTALRLLKVTPISDRSEADRRLRLQ